MFNKKEYAKNYHSIKENKEKQKIVANKWKENNRERRKETSLVYYLKNKEILEEKHKTHRNKLKKETMDVYGGSCSCCGENLLDFLSIDHINNDGAEKRRSLKHGVGHQFYYWLKRNNYPKDYQVLCFNCNFSKSINDECIHQIIKRS